MKLAYAVPHPVAGAIRQRVIGLVKSLRAARPDIQVTVLAPAMDDPHESGILTFIPVEEMAERDSPAAKVARRALLGKATVAELDRLDPDIVLVYGGGALYMGRIQRWARRAGCLVAADAVEWYDPSHLPGGQWGPFALDNELMMRRQLLACDGVIAISRFLEGYVSDRSEASVVVVPPLLDVQAVPFSAPTSGRIQRLAYCGNPGRKDDLGVIIAALAELDPDGEGFELLVAGPSASELQRLPGVTELPRSVRPVGRLSQEDSLALVASATWAPLVRPQQRFAHAGFPTKMVEALAVGTPPMANLTSDLGEYLESGWNSLVIEDADLSSVIATLEAARALSESAIVEMSRRARETAEMHFDFREHATRLGAWLQELETKGAR